MAASDAGYKPDLAGGSSYMIPTVSEDASLMRRDHGPRNRATLKRVALNAIRIVTGRNFIRHTMRDAVLDMRILADILNHMPVA